MEQVKKRVVVLFIFLVSLTVVDLYGYGRYGYGSSFVRRRSDIAITVKAGLIWADMLVERLNSHSGDFSVNGGIGVEKNIVSSWLKFAPELFYYQNGCHIDYWSSENVYLYTELRVYKYITLPVSLKFVLGDEYAIFIQTGVEPALLISGIQSWRDIDKEESNITSLLNKFELRGLFSLGMQFNWFIMELRLDVSLTPAEDNLEWGKMRNYSAGIIGGIKFDI